MWSLFLCNFTIILMNCIFMEILYSFIILKHINSTTKNAIINLTWIVKNSKLNEITIFGKYGQVHPRTWRLSTLLKESISY